MTAKSGCDRWNRGANVGFFWIEKGRVFLVKRGEFDGKSASIQAKFAISLGIVDLQAVDSAVSASEAGQVCTTIRAEDFFAILRFSVMPIAGFFPA